MTLNQALPRTARSRPDGPFHAPGPSSRSLGRWTFATLRKIICVCIALLLFPGCGEKKEPKEHLRHAAEKITGIKAEDIERIKWDFQQLKEANERGDFDGLKRLCAELDARYDQRILTWYADILFIEHTKGIVAAREEIARLKAKEKLGRKEARALDDIDVFFRNKGDMTTAMGTARLLLGCYAVYVEAEFGHGASAPIGALLEMTSKEAKSNAAATGSQPLRAETNSTPGSRR